jgi:ribulose-bisphosphate carboxylase large chain
MSLKFDDLVASEYDKKIVDNYVIVTYDVSSNRSLRDAAWDIALGQSVGNPNVRNNWETKELFDTHCCKILIDKNGYVPFSGRPTIYGNEGRIKIAFPAINTNWVGDGIAHLLCQIMGGQTDIDHITKCRVVDISFPETVKLFFKGPKYGLSGMRSLTNNYDKPLLGGIMKPKTGLTPQQMLDMTKQMVDGGVDFIKEDEILSNPHFCPLQERVDLIAQYQARSSRKFVYAFCINGDPDVIAERTKFVANNGGNGVHINIWSGLGAYRTIRQLNYPLYIHYQKSGDKVITHPGNAFGISWLVLVKLAALCGVDTIHTGMFGGYLNDDVTELKAAVKVLVDANVVPALSCGMHPGLVERIRRELGDDWMANVGGAIHGHPDGTKSGAAAMRQAIDRNYKQEYGEAVNKWGIK